MVWDMSNIFFKVKDKLLHQVYPTTKKETQYIMGSFRFWR
jgi:hypothetical protein